MSLSARAVADKIMNEISVNEHFVDELRSNPRVALTSIGISDENAFRAINDMDWDAPDAVEQLKDRISKTLLV